MKTDDETKTTTAAEAMLRGALPVLWVALATMAAFVNFMPANDPNWAEIIVLAQTKMQMLVVMSAILLAILTLMFGLPTRREIVAATVSATVAVLSMLGTAILFGLEHPLWFLVTFFVAVLPASWWVFMRALAVQRHQ